ncbi:MAG: proteasome accessory factor PafA2 family protein [Candidatus Harrisonbacteria bacterium]|nr:proteasome accessory factor PafA2 family protein [Candidatus Harrisonbacteria bacterium]
MQKRLCGREQEFGAKIILSSGGLRKLKLGTRADVICKIISLIADVVPAVTFNDSSSDYWLCNGSRVYLDMDSVETSTAEHLAGSFDGIAQEKALELILNKAVQSIIRSKIGLESVALYKNNVWLQKEDGRFQEETYGSHHNYSYLTKKRERVFGLMKNFIPAALPLTGNGHALGLRSGQFVYCLSQRARHIILVKHDDTSSVRPIINLRDEPLMNESTGLSRLHLISRDATRCEFQTWLVDTITHLVLRLAEEGWQLRPSLVLERPLAELHHLNFKFDLNYELKTASCAMDVVDYNYLFLRAAEKLKPLSEPEKLCLQEWERVLELLKARAFDQLVGELDWVTKWWLLKKKMSKYASGSRRKD